MAPKLQNHIIDKGWVSTYVISLFWQIALNIRKWWLAKMRNTCHDWSEIHCVTVGRRVNTGDVTSPFVVFESCFSSFNLFYLFCSAHVAYHFRPFTLQQILILQKFCEEDKPWDLKFQPVGWLLPFLHLFDFEAHTTWENAIANSVVH